MRTQRERIAARHRRGLSRPGPVRVRVVNLASVSSRPERVAEVLDTAVRGRRADLILAVECGDLTVSKHVDAAVWQVVQFGRSITDPGERVARSGSALLMRREVGKLEKPHLTVGAEAGEGIRTRYVLSARGTFHRRTPAAWRAWVRVGHAPPGRAPRGRDRFLDRLRTFTGIRGGDFNVSRTSMLHRFTARIRSADVMHLIVPRWMPASDETRWDIGSDHKALDTTVWPEKVRTR